MDESILKPWESIYLMSKANLPVDKDKAEKSLYGQIANDIIPCLAGVSLPLLDNEERNSAKYSLTDLRRVGLILWSFSKLNLFDSLVTFDAVSKKAGELNLYMNDDVNPYNDTEALITEWTRYCIKINDVIPEKYRVTEDERLGYKVAHETQFGIDLNSVDFYERAKNKNVLSDQGNMMS